MKIVFLALAICAASIHADIPLYEKRLPLQLNDPTIKAGEGHFSPLVTDWNNDGKKDLILGQFNHGKLRLYLNTGSNSNPVLRYDGFMRAGGAEISLSSG